ncbi:hypothetical protein PV325_007282 [Microctonus aethiopoides]|nr:hypothetical protein PV325_007282 [Microctonus aethiopoides]
MSEDTTQFQIPHIEQSYCFKWSDYQNHLSNVVQQLLEEDCMVDVTLCVAGERIHAHRIEVLSESTEDHPTIIISDISPEDMRSIVEFSYHGEVKIPVESISHLLDAAHSLKICGLMEIEGLDENDSLVNAKDCIEDNTNTFDHSNELENKVWQTIEEVENSEDDGKLNEDNAKVNKKNKKRRRETAKREYNNDMLEAAINDVRGGQSLVDAATKNNVPRSTLYMRAKALGIQLNAARNEYPAECIKAAINAVINGASFQQASDLYSIPKTVLWRRIQKEGYHILRSEMKRSYDAGKREAAVKALERGENLTKVALEFKIPKTTLFRDKTRLVDQGKLPESFWRKRKTEDEQMKKLRLEEAVAACIEGKMSQAAAAVAFHIPKTTIWRRLQKENRKTDRNDVHKRQTEKVEPSVDDKIKCEDNAEFSLCEVSSDIPITYIDENSLPEDSVIILTTDDVDELGMDDNREIVVNTDSGHEFIPCSLNIEDSANYASSES